MKSPSQTNLLQNQPMDTVVDQLHMFSVGSAAMAAV